MISQCWGVATTLVWSGVGSAILYKVVDVIVGLRATSRPSVKASMSRAHGARLQHVGSPGVRSPKVRTHNSGLGTYRQCPDR